jgi:NAD(P)-dependent dehydrogenase (short-subunit alcohol dehydrogenase family)
VKAYFLLTKYFISSLPSPTTPVTVINITSGAAWLLHPTIAGYSVSKLASVQWSAHLDAAYKGSLTVVNVHPGIVETDMLSDGFRYFDKDSPLLTGGVCAWIAADPERSRFLSGRSISANWDIDELLARASEIESSMDLKIDLLGKIGGRYFE